MDNITTANFVKQYNDYVNKISFGTCGASNEADFSAAIHIMGSKSKIRFQLENLQIIIKHVERCTEPELIPEFTTKMNSELSLVLTDFKEIDPQELVPIAMLLDKLVDSIEFTINTAVALISFIHCKIQLKSNELNEDNRHYTVSGFDFNNSDEQEDKLFKILEPLESATKSYSNYLQLKP